MMMMSKAQAQAASRLSARVGANADSIELVKQLFAE
jgi:hypothetical protein